MDSKKNVIVVSARRGGTHLLVDLIVNNFGYESIDKNYLDYTKFEWPALNGLYGWMNEGNKVTWTHSHNYRSFYKHNHSIDLGDEEKLQKIFSESKIILIYRDVRDIMTSCYHRPHIKNKYTSFSDFYENFDFNGYKSSDKKHDNFLDLLIDYYKNWFSVYMSRELLDLDMEIISFEEIINEYDSSVNKIAKFLGHTISKPVDVRLPNEANTDIKYTTHDFRIGQVGTWVDTIDAKLGNKIQKKYMQDVGLGIDCYLNDVQINKYHKPERDKFKLEYKDWWAETGKVIAEVNECDIKINADNIDTKKLIQDRYRGLFDEPLLRGNDGDFRYYHKVFYFDDYLLKFIYPCKAALDPFSFGASSPVSSMRLSLVIKKTNSILYELGIIPKLYDVGIYKGVLFVVQEKYEASQVLCSKYNIYPEWEDWKWPVDIGVYPQILKHFKAALEHNILLTDIVNVYNCAIDENGDLKYFDLDGIKHFNSKEEMLASEDYKNIMGILTEVDQHYIKKNNNSLLEGEKLFALL